MLACVVSQQKRGPADGLERAPPMWHLPITASSHCGCRNQAVDRIADAIWQVAGEDADGTAVRLADGPYPGSVFYAGSETYDAFHTCNTWTAPLLHDAGFPVNARVLFAGERHAAGGADRRAPGALIAVGSAGRCGAIRAHHCRAWGHNDRRVRGRGRIAAAEAEAPTKRQQARAATGNDALSRHLS